MFRGGRLGGIQGAAGAAFHAQRQEFDEILKTTSSLKRVKTASSSMLTTVANSPKWIKLDGIHQRYVRRAKLEGVAWILSTKGSVFIGIAIAVQSFVLGLELQFELEADATLRQQGGPAFYTLLVVDCILLVVFTLEYVLRSRVLKWKYMCSSMGLLDLILVLSAGGYIVVVQLSSLQINGTLRGVVRAIRLLRILRVVHLLQIMPALALLVKGLVSTIITIMDAMILLAILSYIGALICSEVLGRKHASNSELKSFFSSVPLSFLTHIQLVLVEGWPAISGPMLTDSKFWAAYLVIFICLSNFALLNLVTGVVCERVMELARQLPPATAEEKQFEFDLLKQQMAEIYDATPKRFPDHLNQHEYSRLFKSILASELLDELKVTLPTHSDLLRCLIDEDDNGKVTCAELQEGLMRLRGNRFDDVSRAMQCTVRKCTHRCIRSLDEAEVDVTKALTEAMQEQGAVLHGKIDQIDSDLLSHIQVEAARLRKEKVKKQHKNLLETTCAMKSLKYAISALQKECKHAIVPECGALTNYKGRNGRKATNREAQTEEMQDSPGESTLKELVGAEDKMFSADDPPGRSRSLSPKLVR
ncbi:unnamed protein product [Cladocopium goreaui]|uniref:Voltage-dependent L-type calcium channel subunit alpha-1F n=1 Tax=Cladocopium goreaui TaxID=2562237 RepID=A0A9P1GGB6_9DINO|nr:unnamed protein product [Cladocopium goreaui]